MGYGNKEIKNIYINGENFSISSETNTLANAIEEIRKKAKEMSLKLCSLEHDFYNHLNQIGASADETIESSNENLLGEFWSEIEKNNMFLQNLK